MNHEYFKFPERNCVCMKSLPLYPTHTHTQISTHISYFFLFFYFIVSISFRFIVCFLSGHRSNNQRKSFPKNRVTFFIFLCVFGIYVWLFHLIRLSEVFILYIKNGARQTCCHFKGCSLDLLHSLAEKRRKKTYLYPNSQYTQQWTAKSQQHIK